MKNTNECLTEMFTLTTVNVTTTIYTQKQQTYNKSELFSVRSLGKKLTLQQGPNLCLTVELANCVVNSVPTEVTLHKWYDLLCIVVQACQKQSIGITYNSEHKQYNAIKKNLLHKNLLKCILFNKIKYMEYSNSKFLFYNSACKSDGDVNFIQFLFKPQHSSFRRL